MHKPSASALTDIAGSPANTGFSPPGGAAPSDPNDSVPSRIVVDGLQFDNVDIDEATDRIVHLASLRDRPRYVCTGNLDHLAVAATDAGFRAAYEQADLVVADGKPVVWLSELAGTPLKERVSGIDLFWKLGEASARTGVSLFLLGGVPGAAQAAQARIEERYSGARIVGAYCPPFETFDTPAEQDRIAQKIHDARPDILFVALGAPKQEKWIVANKQRLGVPVSIGVGGSFELATGMLRRAPGWMQQNGMEWAYRLAQQPGRLFHRYIIRDLPYLVKAAGRTVRERARS